MKTLRKFSGSSRSELFFIRKFTFSNSNSPINSSITASQTLTRSFIQNFCSQSTPSSSSSLDSFPDVYSLVADKWTNAETRARDELCRKVARLGEELVSNANDDDEDGEEIERILDEKGLALFRLYPDGEAFTKLLDLLVTLPSLAIKVADWRRRRADYCNPMTQEEYTKLIWLAGRLKNLDLAVEFFVEACNKRLKTSSTCNALMAVYKRYGLAEKCQSLFRDMKKESVCSPTIVTYNILISVFGRSMLLGHMDATFQEVKDLNISPNLVTYNNLIAGYVTTWMWDRMEKTCKIMQEDSTIKPNIITHSLMIRGYAHSGQLEKMEEVYSLVEDHVNNRDISLVRAMICAYCQSSDINRVKKIGALLEFIPENEYRAWFNVLLIKLYAQESLLDEMESSIEEAFKHNTSVIAVNIMRCIISSYFRNNSVDKLSNFVKRAEEAGWRIYRSLYHCKMVMYSAQNRLGEMESVLDEMGKYNIYCSKKTFWILYKAYSRWGQGQKVNRVLGLMCKYGYEIPSPPPIPKYGPSLSFVL